jgi:hypothetical protein
MGRVQPAPQPVPQEELVSSPGLRRLATVVTTASLAAMLLGTGAAVASPPGWIASPITKLPPTVGVGSDAGYSFSVTNGGSSNIATFFLVAAAPTAPAVYAHWKITIDSGATLIREGDCPTDAQLKCTLGALNSGQTASFLIAYTVGSSNFSVDFQANTTGSIQAPNGHNHGDALEWTATTSVSSSKDFAGGFQLDGGTFTTGDSLGKRNIQSTGVHSTLKLVPVNVTDGYTSYPGSGTDPCDSLSCVGDWAQISVGTTGTQGPIEVKILIYGQSVKGNPSLTDFGLWHDGSNPNPITLSCDDPTAIPNGGSKECVSVTMQGNNYLLDGWLIHNGNVRGLLG